MNLVKKLIAILFVFVILCANTEMHELIKLPLLIHHYLDHLSHDHHSDNSFADFLNDHYNNSHSNSGDENRDHNNLPFKTADVAGVQSFILSNNLPYNTLPQNALCHDVTIVYNETINPSGCIANIWQPPKML